MVRGDFGAVHLLFGKPRSPQLPSCQAFLGHLGAIFFRDEKPIYFDASVASNRSNQPGKSNQPAERLVMGFGRRSSRSATPQQQPWAPAWMSKIAAWDLERKGSNLLLPTNTPIPVGSGCSSKLRLLGCSALAPLAEVRSTRCVPCFA